MKNHSKIITILKWGALLGAGLSLIKLLTYFGESIDYEFGPVVEFAVVACIVFLLYLGIKEVRDKLQDGIISFPKAFVVGIGIVFVAAIVAFGDYLIHYNYIDPKGIDKVNDKNFGLRKTAIGKDTVTTMEIRHYCTEVRKVVIKQEAKTDIDTAEYRKVDSGLQVIMDAFEKQLVQRSRTYRLDSFNFEAESTLHALTKSLPNNIAIDTTSLEIIAASYDSIHAIDVFANRIESERGKGTIPFYRDAMALAASNTLSILIYGIFLNIFVALFLYRKEKRVCSASEENEEIEGLKD